jgi:hypothetical protein
MSPRIIHIPLSGGDRKAQAKGIRYAHGIHANHYRQSVLIRSAAEAKLRKADRLECEAWNAIMWAGGPAMPSPSEPQAEPTIGKAINGGYDLLEAKCNRCDRVSLVTLRSLKRHPGLEAGGGALLRAMQRSPAIQPPPAGAHRWPDLCAAGAGARMLDRNQASAMKRIQKITFGKMGVRGVLIWCRDYKCSHSIAVSADRWPDHVRLSKLRQVDVVRKLANLFPLSPEPEHCACVQTASRRVFATNRPYVRFSTMPRGPKGDGQTRRVSSTTHRAPGRFIAG